MGGLDSRNDVKSDMEWLGGLGEPTLDTDDAPVEAEAEADDAISGESADGWSDVFGELDGLLVLRRLAQEASKPDKTRARFRGLRRHARHDN